MSSKLAVIENGAVNDEDDSGDHAIVATGRLRMGRGVAAKDEADLAARCHWKFNETVTTLVARSCVVIDENGAGEDEGDSGDHAIVAAGRLRMGHGVAAKIEADVVARHNWKLNETVTAFGACSCEFGGQCTWPADE